MPNERAMKKVCHRARQAEGIDIAGPVPRAPFGWEIPAELQVFEDGTRFVLHDSGVNDPQRIIILGSERALHQLGTCDHFFSDGTFTDIPLFQQLYIVHGVVVIFFF